MRQPGVLEPFAKPGTNPDYDETNLSAADVAAQIVSPMKSLAGNTVRHAKSPGSIEIWSDSDEIVCEIRDEGVIEDPLAGRQPPPPDANGGHGLWLVHQVCDRVDLHSDDSGTVIRMHMSLR